jgi:hypothetical protein
MLKTLLCIVLMVQSAIVFSQSECNRYIVKSKKLLQSTVYQADSALRLSLREDIVGKLLVNDAGLKETVNFDFTFTDKQGRPLDMNDILTIHFADLKAEFIARTKRIHTGKITFAIVRQTETRLGTVLTDEDQLLYEKLKTDRITYLELGIDSQKHKMILEWVDAEKIRQVIGCLSKRKKY